jgi:hypothetical protein
MTAPIVYSNTPLTSYIKTSELPSWDSVRGDIVTQIWGGLYTEKQAKYDELKEADALTISSQKAGALCYLTAVFARTPSSGGGGGGAVEPITIRWDTDADILEFDLARLRAWGPSDLQSEADQFERAKKLLTADKYLDAGDWNGFKANTFLESTWNYGKLKASGVTGFMRANFVINKTTTWANRTDIDSYISYGTIWKVVAFSDIGYPYKEPKFQDSLADGTWGSYSCRWLTMPHRTSSQTRTHTLYQSWIGAREWKKELYDNG